MEHFPEPYIDHLRLPFPHQNKTEPVTRPEGGKETQSKELKLRDLQNGASVAVILVMTFVFLFEWDTSKAVSLVINAG